MKIKQVQDGELQDDRTLNHLEVSQESRLQDEYISQEHSAVKLTPINRLNNKQGIKMNIIVTLGFILLFVVVYGVFYSIKGRNAVEQLQQKTYSKDNKVYIQDKPNINTANIVQKDTKKQTEEIIQVSNNPSNFDSPKVQRQESNRNEIKSAYEKTINNLNSITNTKKPSVLNQQKEQSKPVIKGPTKKPIDINQLKKLLAQNEEQQNKNRIAIDSKLQMIESQLEKTMMKQYAHDCIRLQTFFHYYKNMEKTMYYRGLYPLYFPACYWKFEDDEYTVGRLMIQPWDQQRQMIEWARKYVRQDDDVLFDCPGCKNYQQLLMLSKFVGKNGEVLVLDVQRNNCIVKTRELNKVDNIRFIARIKGIYQKFKIVISFNEDFFAQEVDGGLVGGLPYKRILFKVSNKDKSIRALRRLKREQDSYFNKVYFNHSECKGTTKPVEVDFKAGYYQIVSKQISVSQYRVSEPIIQLEGPFLNQMEAQYIKYKQTIPSPSQRKDISKITDNFPIPPKKLEELPLKDMQLWVDQSEVVEWVKNRTKGDYNIFLQQSSKFNLLNILNIAALVPNGKVILKLEDSNSTIIQKYTQKMGIKNIIPADQNNTRSALFTAQLLIFDNLATIKQFFAQNNLHERKVLAHFDQKTEGSNDFLFKLYVNHYIRRVSIKPSFYYGYEIFENFFFSSENPTGYFEIQKQTYTIFQFWSQSLEQMNINRRFCIEQITKMNTPEVKVVTTPLLPYFVLPDAPLHKGYEYLTTMQKVDYTRGYFMHFYGGGYADIKHIHYDYLPYFQKLYNGPQDMYAMGFHQNFAYDIVCYPDQQGEICPLMQGNFTKMMGHANFIFKKRSPFTTQWYNRMQKKLDDNYQNLKNNRYLSNRDYKGKRYVINGTQVFSKYPFRWAEMGAAAQMRAQWSYFGHYYLDLPYVMVADYR